MACNIEPEGWQCLLSVPYRQLKGAHNVDLGVGIARQGGGGWPQWLVREVLCVSHQVQKGHCGSSI